jgi:hypothetical protein
LSIGQLSKIQLSLDLSINKTLKLASEVRKAAAAKILYTKIYILYRKIQKFISYVMDKRQYRDAIIKVEIDGGGGFLKICLSLLPKNENEYDYGLSKQGSSSRNVKDTSVKQLFISGIVCGVQENYHNIQKLWNLLKLNDIDKFYVATDLNLKYLGLKKCLLYLGV